MFGGQRNFDGEDTSVKQKRVSYGQGGGYQSDYKDDEDDDEEDAKNGGARKPTMIDEIQTNDGSLYLEIVHYEVRKKTGK